MSFKIGLDWGSQPFNYHSCCIMSYKIGLDWSCQPFNHSYCSMSYRIGLDWSYQAFSHSCCCIMPWRTQPGTDAVAASYPVGLGMELRLSAVSPIITYRTWLISRSKWRRYGAAKLRYHHSKHCCAARSMTTNGAKHWEINPTRLDQNFYSSSRIHDSDLQIACKASRAKKIPCYALRSFFVLKNDPAGKRAQNNCECAKSPKHGTFATQTKNNATARPTLNVFVTTLHFGFS